MECCGCFQQDKSAQKNNKKSKNQKGLRPKSQWLIDPNNKDLRHSENIRDINNVLNNHSYISPRRDQSGIGAGGYEKLYNNTTHMLLASSSYDLDNSWIMEDGSPMASNNPLSNFNSKNKKNRVTSNFGGLDIDKRSNQLLPTTPKFDKNSKSRNKSQKKKNHNTVTSSTIDMTQLTMVGFNNSLVKNAAQQIDMYMSFLFKERIRNNFNKFMATSDPQFQLYKQLSVNAPNIYTAKTFTYLCANCQKGFSKVMLVEFKMIQHKELTLMRIQELFNYAECFDCKCAYCEVNCQLVLNTSFMIGDKKSMENFDIQHVIELQQISHENYDMESSNNQATRFTPPFTGNQQNISNQLETAGMSDRANYNQQFDQKMSLDHSHQQNFSPNNPQSLHFQQKKHQKTNSILSNQNISNHLQISNKPSSVVLKHKIEKLKGLKIYAQVILVGEPPLQPKSKHPHNKNDQNSTHPLYDQHHGHVNQTDQSLTQLSLSHHNVMQSQSNNQTQFINLNQLKYQSPDTVTTVDKQECHRVNAQMMRAMIEKKMKRNESYYELKVKNKPNNIDETEDHLDERQKSPGGNLLNNVFGRNPIKIEHQKVKQNRQTKQVVKGVFDLL
eukprot:403360658